MTRNTHHRQRDHEGLDLDTSIELDGATASYADGTSLHDVIEDLDSRITTTTSGLNIVFDGGQTGLSTGVKGDVEMPWAGSITAARLFADQSGSIVIDIWKRTYANFPPLDSDSITSATPPTLSGAAKSEDTSLSGWTTAFAAGDILRFNIDSVATVNRVTLSLRLERT